MKREFLQNLKTGDQPLSKEVIDAIMAENGRDIEAARQAGSAWEEKYHRAAAAHSQELAALRLDSALETAVVKTGGRNTKAIAALLDLEAIRTHEDLPGALEEALTQLKKEHSYLFDTGEVPPPYARGTGAREGAPTLQPASLAGALREKYERK